MTIQDVMTVFPSIACLAEHWREVDYWVMFSLFAIMLASLHGLYIFLFYTLHQSGYRLSWLKTFPLNHFFPLQKDKITAVVVVYVLLIFVVPGVMTVLSALIALLS